MDSSLGMSSSRLRLPLVSNNHPSATPGTVLSAPSHKTKTLPPLPKTLILHRSSSPGRRCSSSTVVSSYSARRPSERSFGGRDRRPSYSPDVSELDIQEQIAQLDLEPHKLLVKGDPNSMQAVIKDVMPVGYFVSLPTGRDGYLPADDLGFTGGLAVLQRLFKEGQEITVRIVCRGGAGREIVSIKKPEFAPPSEQKTIESLRLHFENEKKNRMNPRNRRHQNYNNNNY